MSREGFTEGLVYYLCVEIKILISASKDVQIKNCSRYINSYQARAPKFHELQCVGMMWLFHFDGRLVKSAKSISGGVSHK